MVTTYYVKNYCVDEACEKHTTQTVLDDTWKAPECAGHTTRDFCIERIELTPFSRILSDASEFIQQTVVSYINVGYILFPGTDAGGIPVKFAAIANVLGGNGVVRLYDPINVKQIATLTVTNTGLGISETSTLTDLPTTETLLQIQIRGDGTNWLRYYAAELE